MQKKGKKKKKAASPRVDDFDAPVADGRVPEGSLDLSEARLRLSEALANIRMADLAALKSLKTFHPDLLKTLS